MSHNRSQNGEGRKRLLATVRRPRRILQSLGAGGSVILRLHWFRVQPHLDCRDPHHHGFFDQPQDRCPAAPARPGFFLSIVLIAYLLALASTFEGR
jgi:hypothetical protein